MEMGPATAGLRARAAQIIGVVGAGTMGAGIAQLAARAGAQTLMYDPIAEALERGRGQGARRARQRSGPGPAARGGGGGGRRAPAAGGRARRALRAASS